MLRLAVLTVTLVLACLIGVALSYLLVLLAALALVPLIRSGGLTVDAAGRLFLAAFAAIAVLFALSARQPADVLLAVNFTALVAYVPLAALLGRGAAPGNATIVARLALAGAALGCALSLYDVFVLGTGRAGNLSGITDTIRLGDTAVLLGFLALVGLVQEQGRNRWLYLLGPLLAAVVALLTGARGAMLAIPLLSLLAVFVLMRNKWLAAALGGGVAIALVAAALGGVIDNVRLDSAVGVFRELAAGQPVTDEAMAIRFKLYAAGWEAFLQSPLIGHGWAGMMPAVEHHLAEADKVHAQLPHVHNELLNFAVFGGIAGVAVYLMLMALPIAFALRSRRDGQSRARLAGTILLVGAYAVLGLPDTMLSFEIHTAMYVALVAILLSYCRDTREPAAR